MRATVGGWPVGKLDSETQAKMGADEAEFLPADFVEEARAIAQDRGNARDRIPDHVAKPAQTGERHGDLIPV